MAVHGAPVPHVPAALTSDPALLAALLDAAPAGFAYLDRDLRYVHINPSLAGLNGLPVADHLGRTVSDVVPALAEEVGTHVLGVLRDGRPRLGVEVSGAIAGRTRHFSTSWYPVRDDGTGEVLGVAVLATDVTDLVEAGEAQRQTALAL